jgi:hypothetical protein
MPGSTVSAARLRTLPRPIATRDALPSLQVVAPDIEQFRASRVGKLAAIQALIGEPLER